ncbi:four helix bundle protein [Pedobacter sp. AJM]|jgi:four helix bundle protein|uniref:four helix bundle protein n=1 Tax=Pedobacter sp. AJM TaxID=2003629 RepID=UPI000B4BE111|nr:four helix bundle protein [Pedobacter sp. AJM]OWK69524.1 four helix bundle protein [Pedobacter sp. AJM]
MQNFKDLKVWDKAHQLTLSIYKISASFPKEEVYSLTNQLRRASASIPANIAEGCGKNSQADLANFLNISLGSANETEYFLILSKDLDYLAEEQFTILSNSINEVKAMLISLILKVRTKRQNL